MSSGECVRGEGGEMHSALAEDRGIQAGGGRGRGGVPGRGGTRYMTHHGALGPERDTAAASGEGHRSSRTSRPFARASQQSHRSINKIGRAGCARRSSRPGPGTWTKALKYEWRIQPRARRCGPIRSAAPSPAPAPGPANMWGRCAPFDGQSLCQPWGIRRKQETSL